jgi:HSP20 family molecular chaperone IbpA
MTTFIHNEGNELNDLHAGPAHPYSSSLLQLFNNFAHHLSFHHYYPRFDIEEHEYSYEIYGDLPGVEQASLEIATLDGHSIEISGSTASHGSDEPEALGNGESRSAQDGISRADSVPVTHNTASAPPTLAAAHAEQLAAEEKEFNSGPPPAAEADRASDGGELTKTHCMHGQKEVTPAKEMKTRYLTRERQRGKFHRFFPFINAIKEEEVTASFHNGVLHVRVPKGPAGKKNHVEIHHGSLAMR